MIAPTVMAVRARIVCGCHWKFIAPCENKLATIMSLACATWQMKLLPAETVLTMRGILELSLHELGLISFRSQKAESLKTRNSRKLARRFILTPDKAAMNACLRFFRTRRDLFFAVYRWSPKSSGR